MVLLAMRFLPGCHWITIVDACAQDIVYTAFKSFRMLEFTAPVTVIPNSG
jgi:hypothetical protein